jgi:drug/metabolite transporter (DMT)-like permease
VIYGLTAAVAWGASAVTGTIAARRAGTFITVLVGQGVGMIVLIVLAAALHPSLSTVKGAAAWGLIGAGLIGLLGYLSFYRALELGPVGLVSSIGATYGGVTAIMAFLLLGERLGVAGTAGVAVAVAGVAMASSRSQAAKAASLASGEPIVGVAPAPAASGEATRAGIPFALVSAATYGVGGFLLENYAGRVGWLGASLVARVASMAVLVIILPFLGRPSAWRGTGSGVAWAAVSGLTDVVGVLVFARGGEIGQVAVTAAVSSVYPIIPLVAGVALFGERVGARQALGVALIIVGLVALGLVT